MLKMLEERYFVALGMKFSFIAWTIGHELGHIDDLQMIILNVVI